MTTLTPEALAEIRRYCSNRSAMNYLTISIEIDTATALIAAAEDRDTLAKRLDAHIRHEEALAEINSVLAAVCHGDDGATEEVSIHMDEILHCFNPGAKITVLVRRPDRPDGSQDFCLSNDDLSDAVAALMIRAKKENRP